MTLLCGTSPESQGEAPKFGLCPKCKREHHLCPECGAFVEYGYGLAGGGMGVWYACSACDYFYKEQDKDRGPQEGEGHAGETG